MVVKSRQASELATTQKVVVVERRGVSDIYTALAKSGVEQSLTTDDGKLPDTTVAKLKSLPVRIVLTP